MVGCIVGPLLSGFLLLPFLGERWSTLVLTLPWLAMAIRSAYAAQVSSGDSGGGLWRCHRGIDAFCSLLRILRLSIRSARFCATARPQ